MGYRQRNQQREFAQPAPVVGPINIQQSGFAAIHSAMEFQSQSYSKQEDFYYYIFPSIKLITVDDSKL